jgi:shikimate dehydrogenase
VLGSPIAHSLSPVLHRAAYEQLGLDWTYDAVEVDPEALPAFIAGCGREWVGLSLTMPLKRAVLPLLDTTSDLVDLVGAANTVVLGRDGLAGYNTDVMGVFEALREIGAQPGPAVVLGAGATAGSALAALAQIGCSKVVVRARRPEAAASLAGVASALGIDLTVRDWPTTGEGLPGRKKAAIVVCTVPGSVASGLVDAVPGDPGALLDVSYDPWPPDLVAAWRAAGGTASAGDAMLLHQAVSQVELMSGSRPDVEVMRAALRAEIASRTQASG